MELDEMKQAWAQMDLRQDGMEALLRQDFRDRRLDNARASMRWSLLMGDDWRGRDRHGCMPVAGPPPCRAADQVADVATAG